MTDAHRAVDVIARLAEAWDLRGRHTLKPGFTEHKALLQLARLDAEQLCTRPWNSLSGDQRHHLLFAARLGVELGKLCAWCFGEAYGGVDAQVQAERAKNQQLQRELAEVRRELDAANALALERVFGEGRGA